MTFIDAERETYGVEPMGAGLPIAPATYFRHKAWQAHPDQRCPRARRDAWLTTQIQRVWDEIHRIDAARLRARWSERARCLRLLQPAPRQDRRHVRRLATVRLDVAAARGPAGRDRARRCASCGPAFWLARKSFPHGRTPGVARRS